MLCYLHHFPLQLLVQAQSALAEAYGLGGYFEQAKKHLAEAREVCHGGIPDVRQRKRLEANLLASEGQVLFAEGQLEARNAKRNGAVNWLEMAQNWLEMAKNSPKWLETA